MRSPLINYLAEGDPGLDYNINLLQSIKGPDQRLGTFKWIDAAAVLIKHKADHI
jgi:predicted NAD/FAD-binding protein